MADTRVDELPSTDVLDIGIVTRLSDKPRATNTELARRFEVVGATIGARVRRLYDEGIAQVVAVTPLSKTKHNVLMMVYARIDADFAPSTGDLAVALAQAPEILMIASLLENYQFLLWISAVDTAHAERIIQSRLGVVRGIESLRVELVTNVGKDSSNLLARLPSGGAQVSRDELGHDQLSEMLNDSEHRILAELRADGRRSVSEIARRTRTSDRLVRSTIESLEEQGLLQFEAVIYAPAFGLTQLALVEIDIDHDRHTSIVSALRARPEFTYVMTTTGRSHRVKGIAQVSSNRALSSLLHEDVAAIPGIRAVRNMPIITGYKHDRNIALGALPRSGRSVGRVIEGMSE